MTILTHSNYFDSNPDLANVLADNFIKKEVSIDVILGYKLLSEFLLEKFLYINEKIDIRAKPLKKYDTAYQDFNFEIYVASHLFDIKNQIKNGYLFVSSENSEHDYFSELENVIFRTVHGYKHFQYNKHFDIDSELELYQLVLIEFNNWLINKHIYNKLRRYAINALFNESVTQLAYLYKHKEFSCKQYLVDYTQLINFETIDLKGV